MRSSSIAAQCGEEVIGMASGGRRARSGPAPDPLSRTSLVNGREFTVLPLTHDVVVPAWPLGELADAEFELWSSLWGKPQALMWDRLGLAAQVAIYVRSFVRAADPDGPVSLLTPVLRMEAELGISTSGMLQNGWVIETPAGGLDRSVQPSKGGVKKQTTTGSWLEAVKVEDA